MTWQGKRSFKGGRGLRLKPGEMNGTERAYSLHLDAEQRAGRILVWRFQPCNWRLADSTYYRPDFLVMRSDGLVEFHDTKGGKLDKKSGKFKAYVETHAKVKIKVVADMYPFAFVYAWPLRKKDGGGWAFERFAAWSEPEDPPAPTAGLATRASLAAGLLSPDLFGGAIA